MEFWEYELESPALCMGELVKGSIYRPCDTRTIRYSIITGALREYLGIANLHAAGFLVDKDGCNQPDHFVYSPRDHITGISKVPITAQFVRNAWGLVYIKKGDFTLPETMRITMGALKSRGFGSCDLRLHGVVNACSGAPGLLRTRIPDDLRHEFGIEAVLQPRWGYLFRPTSDNDGVYILSLCEDSEVVGPPILLKEVRHG